MTSIEEGKIQDKFDRNLIWNDSFFIGDDSQK